MIDALVLAGTGKQTSLTEREKVKNKAFIQVEGQALITYTLKALRSVENIDRIAVVGPVEQLSPLIESFGILVVAEAGTIPDNLLAGSRALRPRQHFLVVSGDIPLLTGKAVEDFVERCKPFDKGFYYPVVSKADSEQRFPGMKRTYVKLKDGIFTGGNLFLVNPDQMEAALPKIEKFFELRKSPLKLAAALKVSFIIKLLSRRLTIEELEKQFFHIFGATGKAVISRFAELSTDVDKESHLELVRHELTTIS